LRVRGRKFFVFYATLSYTHPLPPLERLVEEAEARRFQVVDDEDEIDDDGC
jgi:hypothetical protein